MKITKAEYIISAVGPKQYPEVGQPEIALVGRSNVGKSSLINKFINRKGLARTSSQPGKTQTLNFYHLNEAWFFVDLPGYGYAKVSKAEQNRWGRFIDGYLNKREELVGVIQIVDIRHPPSKDDITMAQWLKASGLPFLIVANKADKISRGRWSAAQDLIRKDLGLAKQDNLITFSAENAAGLPELSRWVSNILESCGIEVQD